LACSPIEEADNEEKPVQLCPLEDIDMLITDDRISDADAQKPEQAGVKLIVAPIEVETE